jgi:hypothetical protein
MTPKERTFLIEFRDYLATAAYPANTSTIAFSTLASEAEKVRQSQQRSFFGTLGALFVWLFRLLFVSRTLPAQAASDDHMIDAITSLFPLYGTLAENFRLLVLSIRTLALALTFIVVIVSAYVYWGNLVLSKLDAIDAQQAKLTAQIMAEESVFEARQLAVEASASAGPAFGVQPRPVVRDCVYYSNAGSAAGTPFRDSRTQAKNGEFLSSTSIRYGQVCDELDQLGTTRDATVDELITFVSVPNAIICEFSRLTDPFGPCQRNPQPDSTKLYASALVSMLNGYVTSVLMGLLGAAAFILRSYLTSLAAKTLHPRDSRAYGIRLVLGAIAGLAIGFFMGPGAALTAQTQSVSSAISLTGPAIAFLAGYAVEVMFGFLDAIARTVFPAGK